MKHLLDSECFDENGNPTIHMYMAMMSDYTLFLGETSDDGGRDSSDELHAFEVGLEEELYRVFREERNSGKGMEGDTGFCRESSLAADAVAGNIVSELTGVFGRTVDGELPWSAAARRAMGFEMAYGFEFWNVYRMHLARRVGMAALWVTCLNNNISRDVFDMYVNESEGQDGGDVWLRPTCDLKGDIIIFARSAASDYGLRG